MSILPQSNLHIQSNPYQATNGIFHRTRTNNFSICMEKQKNFEEPKLSSERRMELEESTCLTSGSATKPQSSRQYGTGTKTEIYKGNRIKFITEAQDKTLIYMVK